MGSRKNKILIIDDEQNNIMFLKKILGTDYETIVAENGHKGLEQAQKVVPDLILLDIMMSDMDGYEVCRRLKNNEVTKGLPVIFIAARDEVDAEARGIDLGAVDYMTKPFHPIIIKARIRTHIELKHKTDLLESMVSLDGLTEIPNSRRFDEVLDAEWRRAVRTASSMALVLIDIDYFKQFNDHYGHAAGDDCLKKAAQALQKCIHRPTDLAARYGGDAFALVLPETDLKGALHVAEMARQRIERLAIPHEYSNVNELLTVSMGVAALKPKVNLGQKRLFQTADDMLYKAKASGRNTLCHFEG